MKKRKVLALLASELSQDHNNRMIEGIMQQAYALDYNVVVFYCISAVNTHFIMSQKQMDIFEYINFDMVDGVIMAQNTMQLDEHMEYINKLLLEKCKKPVVVLSDKNEHFPNIPLDDRSAFRALTSHIIQKHHANRLYCLTGFDYIEISHLRANGFCDALRDNGVELHDGDIIYGDFWTVSPVKLADEIISGVREKPDAIICASDVMAVYLCQRLIEFGVNVPDDVIITGYDALPEALENIPSITTCELPIFNVATKAVCYLHKQITGEYVKPILHDSSSIIYGESCGCRRQNSTTTEIVKEEHARRYFTMLYDSSYMAQTLSCAESFNDFLSSILSCTYIIDKVREYHLCLCDDWMNNPVPEPREGGPPETMHHLISYSRTYFGPEYTDYTVKDIVHDSKFPTALMLPQLWEEREEPTTFYFTPLNFNERFYGYSVISYGTLQCYPDKIYSEWNLNIDTGLELVRTHQYLKQLNHQVYLSSLRDALTGIYNRTGFNSYANEKFMAAMTDKLSFFLVITDLDGLKIINDTYGHIEGDSAIKIAAQALNIACLDNEVCARIGGDEFAVIGCGYYTKNTPGSFKSRVNAYLERYNSVAGKPYKVGLSMGVYCGRLTDDETFEEIYKLTDSRMYEEKSARKAGRK